jgi:hypothetical protein
MGFYDRANRIPRPTGLTAPFYVNHYPIITQIQYNK